MAKIDVNEIKKKILLFLDQNGPNIPIPIAKHVNLQPMFASAILSELLNEKRIKTSSIKIGSSPLYMIPGQEHKLENFADNLTGVEKETFLKLKDNKFLDDVSQEPRMRVAMRSLKDFAIPIQIGGKLYWKYFTLPSEKLKELLRDEGEVAIGERVVGQQIWEDIKKEIKPESKEETAIKHEKIVQVISAEAEKTFSKEVEKNEEEVALKQPKADEETIIQQKPNKIKKLTEKDIFLEQTKRILQSKNIELIEVIQYDKQQVVAKARVKVDKTCILFFMDKKRPDEKDLQKAYKKSLEYKLPYYIITHSEPPKKIKDTAEIYKALIGFENID